MDFQHSAGHKTHRTKERPPFERIALLLQGGGALGSYQAGVYQALAEAGLHPDWVAGISIGGINSALIAGNPPEKRVEALRSFWETVTAPAPGLPTLFSAMLGMMGFKGDAERGLLNQAHAFATLMDGAAGFFTPRPVPPFFSSAGSIEAESFYDVAPLKATLERLVDFDRINSGAMRFSAGAVNVRTGNFEYFDTTTHTIRPEHVMASGSLPPGFPATRIDGEYYWDGGLISNTPLQWVLDNSPREDTLAFQVDLWSARGEFPRDLLGIELRQKDIRFSSRTRAATDHFKSQQRLRRALGHLVELVPQDALMQADPEIKLLLEQADEKVYNIVQLVYRAKNYEASSKDYEFSRLTMEEHWASGYNDALRTLRHPEVLQRPATPDGVAIFDFD
ncbi:MULTISPECIES: patatin-like phospholipase family protein [unclassified Rhizobium]|uniref:patatin-like phospholipase family protein n=1 Tax=unclassified Rhizobium TaxID=2613769 RepID=UPI0021699079|nr:MULTISPECIES: patatin-like phospholipase family protein [unclassified Rhizobium]MCS3741590.1 NTE family protein [Rhizobium sp. BK661]MCS4093686.1 NTE family protein [Rhizobium sp. BK176]